MPKIIVQPSTKGYWIVTMLGRTPKTIKADTAIQAIDIFINRKTI